MATVAAVHSSAFFYVHGAFFLLWIVVFVTQTALIASGNTALHRKLGVAGAALIPTMFVLGCVGALIAARRPTGFFDARCCSRRSSCSRR